MENRGVCETNDTDDNKALKVMSVRGKWHRWDLVHREERKGKKRRQLRLNE